MIAAENTVTWVRSYVARQCDVLAALPFDLIGELIEVVRQAGAHRRNIFIIGNGGNAANAAHFATDLGKGASDRGSTRFRVLSLSDNVPWMTALGNDYAFEDVFVRQLMNFAQGGDVLIASSVSGNSPNLVRAIEWANANGVETFALVGSRRGKLAEIAGRLMVIEDAHYGRVEDAQMTILHLLCYALMESPMAELRQEAVTVGSKSRISAGN
jgi:D-sedoheptulose 7-phosphate isomerase